MQVGTNLERLALWNFSFAFIVCPDPPKLCFVSENCSTSEMTVRLLRVVVSLHKALKTL